MAEKDDTIQKLINEIYSLVTLTPEQGDAPQPSNSTMVQLCSPGIPVNEADYRDMMTRANPAGRPSSAHMFASLVDAIPKCGTTSYVPSGNSVSVAFGQCIQAIANSQPDPAQMEKYKKAQKYLFESKTMKDMDGNEVSLPATPTPAYQTYINGLNTYMAASQALQALKNQCDLSTTEGQNKFAVESIMKVNAVNTAYSTWRASGAQLVEQALQVMESSISDVTTYGIEEARKAYAGCQQVDPATGAMHHLSFATPSNWADPSMVDNFSQVAVSHKTKSEVTEDHASKWGANASGMWGLWTFGGSGGHSKKEHHEHCQASNMSVEFSMGTVLIERPWMHTTFFKLGNWYLKGQKSGTVSSGSKPGDDSMLLPQFPTQLVVARNIKISADWTEEDKKHIESATTGGVSIGWGPFKIGGSYEASDSKDTFTSEFDGTTITVPGIQIIGFVCSIPTPACPPIGDPAMS